MAKRQLQYVLAMVGGLLGYQWNEAIEQFLLRIVSPLFGIEHIAGPAYWAIGIGAIVFYGTSGWLFGYGAERIRTWEDHVVKTPTLDLLSGLIGLILGLIISALLHPALSNAGWVGTLLVYTITALLGVYGQSIFVDPELKLVMVVTAAARNANVGKESFAAERGAVWRGVIGKYGNW